MFYVLKRIIKIYIYLIHILEDDVCDETYQVILDKSYEYSRIVKKKEVWKFEKHVLNYKWLQQI